MAYVSRGVGLHRGRAEWQQVADIMARLEAHLKLKQEAEGTEDKRP